MINTANAPIGTARLTQRVLPKVQAACWLRSDVQVGALNPGWHGPHCHAVAVCNDHTAGFMASTGHVGRMNCVALGAFNADGPEAGALPKIYPPEAGPNRAKVFSPFMTLAAATPAGQRMALLDGHGVAIVFHANQDDRQTQPIGGTGARAACGAVTAEGWPPPPPRTPKTGSRRPCPG